MTQVKVDYSEFSLFVSLLVKKLSLLNRDHKSCYGLTMSQCFTIEALAENGKLSMNKLSHELGVTVSTMTRIIDVLLRDGNVNRRDNPDDRRQVCIELTSSGRNLAVKLRQCSDHYARDILDQIPEKEKNGVIKSLKMLVKALESANKKCC
ncbi:MAG: MarR family transcriptional regulator [Bacteroidales bacterium]|nr:MarR family transcriptional regulator [Candidatus Latescibacterota bacterium]